MFEPVRPSHAFSPDQQAAWEAVAGRLSANGIDLAGGGTTPRSESRGTDVLAVMGKAGSGKTVLLAELAHRLEEIGLLPVRELYESAGLPPVHPLPARSQGQQRTARHAAGW